MFYKIIKKSMSTKTVLISLCAAIIIGGVVFFTLEKNKLSQSDAYNQTPADVTYTPPQQDNSHTEDKSITLEPSKTASNDQIIDYIVEGQPSNETKTAKTMINATMTSSDHDVSIRTNF